MTEFVGATMRIRCPACGTEQEADEGAGTCSICGCPFANPGAAGVPPAAQPADVSGATASEVFDLEDPGDEDAAQLVGEQAAPPTRSAEVDEILASEKRATSILALVPVWGALRIWQSDIHGLFEKLFLSALSLALATAIVLGVREWLPDEADKTAISRERIAQDIERLAALVERYRSQYGSVPSPETWKESVDRRDPRFHDPWGSPYVYKPGTSGFTLGSLGQDGQPGGDGADGDVMLEFPQAPR